MPIATAPDVEAALIARLGTHPDVIALGVHVSWQLDDRRPALVVARAGGLTVVRGWLYQPRVQIDVYAPVRAAAVQAALTAQAVLELRGGWMDATTVVTDVTTVLAPTWLYDPSADGHRYTASYLVTAHPRPS
ncbi:hypothetical protein [Frankia sp. Cr1]|uniref:hypothetical protein n=1 Tax=Frankia sp. Cr1 TaxID=3073931 RepID=UPI002AD3A9ED|nr:hypothetical protein [Frankia sp. Cr1]